MQRKNNIAASVLIMSWLCFVYYPASAQNYNYTQYTTEDGLPGNFVYGVIEDEKGYIWAYTENGISKFDGYTFKNYTVQNGLPGNDIYWMVKDSSNCIWLGNIAGKICYLKNDTVHCFEEYDNYKIESILNGKIIYSNTDSTVHCFNGKVVKTIANNWLKPIQFIQKDEIGLVNWNLEDKQKVLSNKNYYEIEGSTINRYALGNVIKENTQRTSDRFYTRDDFIVAALEQGVIFISNKAITHQYYTWKTLFNHTNTGLQFENCGPFSIEINENKETQIATGCSYHIFDEQFKLIQTLYLKNISDKYTLHRLYIDKRGNYWVGTEQGGLFFINKNHQKVEIFKSINPKDKVFKKFIYRKSEILTLTEQGSVYKVQDRQILPLNRFPKVRKLYDLQRWNEHEFLVANNYHTILFYNDNSFEYIRNLSEFKIKKAFSRLNFKSTEDRKRHWGNHKSIELSNDAQWYFWSDQSDTYQYNFRTQVVRTLSDKRSQCIYNNSLNQKTYFAQNKTLLVRNENKLEPLVECGGIINCIYADSANNLLLATENAGLFELDLSNNCLTQISERNDIRTILKDDHFYYLAGRAGVVKIHNKAKHYAEIYCYDKKDGLPVTRINDIVIDDKYIYAATNQYIVKIDKAASIADTLNYSANLNITQFKVNDEIVESQNIPALQRSKNDIFIQFHYLDYSSNDHIKYAHQLKPIEEKWNITLERKARYVDLKPGDYQFNLKAIDALGKEHPLIAPLKFTINKAWWQSSWFSIFATLSFVSLVILAVMKREKILQEKLWKEKAVNDKLAELKMQSLRSQMNPHFIFNALGSIQYYIQDHKIEEADEYLTLFAQLMRRYLDSAIDNLIRLSDELMLLQEYTALEQMRFKTKFETTIEVEEDIIARTELLPSMLIQPFVENAINHGLQHRRKGGELKIKFSKAVENELTCEISDNGIGIEKATLYKKNGHKSRAMLNVQTRLKLFQTSDIASVKIETKPLCVHKEFPGTKIILQFINFNSYEELQSLNNR